MTLLDVVRYFRREWRALIAVVALTTVSAMADAASVILVVGLADAVSKRSDHVARSVGPIDIDVSTNALVVLAVVSVVASVVMMLLANGIRTRLTATWSTDRRLALLRAFLDASWSVQSQERAGRIQTELGYIGMGASLLGSLSGVARGLVGLVILIGAAVLVNPVAAGGIVVLGLLLFLVLRPLNRAVKRRSRETAQLTGRVNQDFGELSELSREIQIFGTAPVFTHRVAAPVGALTEAERRSSTLTAAVTPIYQGMALVVIVVALGIATSLGSLDVATLGAVALLVLRSVSYGQQFQSSLTSIHTATPGLELADQTLERLRAAQTRFGDDTLDRVHTIELDRVTFRYPNEEDAALDDVRLRFDGGDIIGVVGPSGAGKSTLAHLLLRLRDPDEGVVAVNGTPIDRFSVASWSHAVALVPQEPFLMHGSIHDNIAFLRPEVTRDDVVAAAIDAGIHDTIQGLDGGYDAPVGRSVRNLSGGQIQRIGIARALAGHPSMIVLDEPTSALDQHSESVIQSTLGNLRHRALVIVIAHRLTTLSICDRVLVMNGGRVEAEGPLDEVIAQSPFFRSAVEQLAMSSGATFGDVPPER